MFIFLILYFFRGFRIFDELEWDGGLVVFKFLIRELIVVFLNFVMLLRWKLLKCLENERKKF